MMRDSSLAMLREQKRLSCGPRQVRQDAEVTTDHDDSGLDPGNSLEMATLEADSKV